MSSEVKVRVSILSQVQAGLAQIKSQFSSFRSSLNSQVAGLFAFGAITAGVSKLITDFEQLAHIGERFGVPLRELQEIGNVAKLNGASIEDVARSWNFMVRAQEKAKLGNEQMVEAFGRLGISVDEISKMSPSELFFRIADATASATDRSRAYADVVTLMGRGAGVMFTTLEKGSQTIREQGDAMGIASDRAIESARKIAEAWKVAINYLKIGFGEVVVVVQKAMETVGAAVFTSIQVIGNGFSHLGHAISDALHGNFKAAGQELVASVKENIQEVKNLGKDSKDIWSPKEMKKPDNKGGIADPELAQSEQTRLEHIQKLREDLAELQRQTSNDQLEAEAKINALIGQRKALLQEAAGEKDEEKKLALQIDAEKVQKEIDSAKKQQAKELQTAQDKLEKAERDRQYASLSTDAERRKFLEDEIEKITKAIGMESDAASRLNLQTDRENSLNKLLALNNRDDTLHPAVASSLAKIGGGGNVSAVSGGGDAQLREAKNQSQYLKDILTEIKKKNESKILMQ